jgi:recombination protein RecT
MTTAIAERGENQLTRIKGYLSHTKVLEQIEGLLPKHITPERMLRTMLAACQRTPKLAECDPLSLVEAMVKCSEWGLEPVGEHGVWLIPYGDKVQAIRDYRGEMDLAVRLCPELSNFMIPRCVYANDEFDVEYGETPHIRHRPTPLGKDRGSLVGVYAIAKLKDGSSKGVVLTHADVERHRKASRAKDNGPWVTHTESMWLKSAVKELCKWLPRMDQYARMQDDEFDAQVSMRAVPLIDETRPALQAASASQALVRQLKQIAPKSGSHALADAIAAGGSAVESVTATSVPQTSPLPPKEDAAPPPAKTSESAQTTLATDQAPAGAMADEATRIGAIKEELKSLGVELVQLIGDAKRAETIWRASVQSLRGAKSAEHFGARLEQARALLSKHRTAKLEQSIAGAKVEPDPDAEVWGREPTDAEIQAEKLVHRINEIRTKWGEVTGEKAWLLETGTAYDVAQLEQMLDTDAKKLSKALESRPSREPGEDG